MFTIFAHILQSYSCTFFEIHQIQLKNAKLAPKTPNWRVPVNKYINQFFEETTPPKLGLIDGLESEWMYFRAVGEASPNFVEYSS